MKRNISILVCEEDAFEASLETVRLMARMGVSSVVFPEFQLKAARIMAAGLGVIIRWL